MRPALPLTGRLQVRSHTRSRLALGTTQVLAVVALLAAGGPSGAGWGAQSFTPAGPYLERRT